MREVEVDGAMVFSSSSAALAAVAAASASVVVVGEDVGAAAAEGPVGEEEGAEKNDVILFCFCFFTVEAGIAPGNLRLRGADIFF